MSAPIATRQWSWPREASLVHARSFGRPRAMSTVALYTASQRVESPGAVALVTVVPGPWVVAAFGLPVVAAAGLALLAALASLTVDGIVLPMLLFLDAVLMVVVTAAVVPGSR